MLEKEKTILKLNDRLDEIERLGKEKKSCKS